MANKESRLNPISKWFRKHLDPLTRTKVQVGYLNENLARTKEGASMLLDIVEETFPVELKAKLDALRAELVSDEDCPESDD